MKNLVLKAHLDSSSEITTFIWSIVSNYNNKYNEEINKAIENLDIA